jgi:RNA polymerase sigma-70 factor (ECF subfamily)
MPEASPTSPNEYQLLQRVSNGDEDAFKKLYNHHHISVYNYILRLIHEPVVAEDLLQDVFLAVWRGAKKFKGNASVKTWIFRIAHHQTISWLRKHKKANYVENIDNLTLQSHIPLPEDQILEKSEISKIVRALEKLSPNHRSVIELTFMYGFAYKEIAEVMDCPVGTVKSRMSYALRYLEAEIIRQESSSEI